MKRAVIVYVAALLLLAGCAHGPGTALQSGTSSLPSDSGRQFAAAGMSDAAAAPQAVPPTAPSGETAEAEEDFQKENPGYVADPLEPWNRAMFHFNDKLYFWVLKPVARGYRAVIPLVVRTGIKNFFTNLTMPIRLVGCLLQGKGNAAGFEFSRFLVNTTVGVLGFGNPAKDFPELALHEEDLGQTLGSYGIGNGFYIVWPFLGSSTLRDSIGDLGDLFLNPVSYVRPLEAYLGIRAFDTVNSTSFRIGDYESIKDAAFFPYEAFRNAYIQHRKKQISE